MPPARAADSAVDEPRDALALRVLSEAEARLGRSADARAHAAEARKEWHGGDLAKVSVNLT